MLPRSGPTLPRTPWEVALPDGVDLVVLNAAPLELAGTIALEGQVLFADDRGGAGPMGRSHAPDLAR